MTDYQTQLADHLGQHTAAAMTAAGLRAFDRVIEHAEDGELIAGILLGALDGLDGTELVGEFTTDELREHADAVALHLGAEFSRRIRAAEKLGYARGYDDATRTHQHPDPWLLWSLRHGQWWGAGRAGYTSDITRAGRYSQHGAAAAGVPSWDYDTGRPRSVAVLAPSPVLLASPELGELMEARIRAAAEKATAEHHEALQRVVDDVVGYGRDPDVAESDAVQEAKDDAALGDPDTEPDFGADEPAT